MSIIKFYHIKTKTYSICKSVIRFYCSRSGIYNFVLFSDILIIFFLNLDYYFWKIFLLPQIIILENLPYNQKKLLRFEEQRKLIVENILINYSCNICLVILSNWEDFYYKCKNIRILKVSNRCVVFFFNKCWHNWFNYDRLFL